MHWIGFGASRLHILYADTGCLIILEKAFVLDDLGGLYAVRVET